MIYSSRQTTSWHLVKNCRSVALWIWTRFNWQRKTKLGRQQCNVSILKNTELDPIDQENTEYRLQQYRIQNTTVQNTEYRIQLQEFLGECNNISSLNYIKEDFFYHRLIECTKRWSWISRKLECCLDICKDCTQCWLDVKQNRGDKTARIERNGVA